MELGERLLDQADKQVETAEGEGAGSPQGRSSRRSRGLQARSRERVDQLLEAAEALVVAQGFDGLRMRELARSAGLPIASIYHYFPSNAAVLRALAERHLVELQAVIGAAMERHMTPDLDAADAPEAVARVVIDVATYLASRPATATIWDALRAVPELRALDMEDTARNARFIEPYFARLSAGEAADRADQLEHDCRTRPRARFSGSRAQGQLMRRPGKKAICLLAPGVGVVIPRITDKNSFDGLEIGHRRASKSSTDASDVKQPPPNKPPAAWLHDHPRNALAGGWR